MSKPNVLFLMCDQLRFDAIAALGNAQICTPNLDRLVKRGVSFTNAYSSCPVCVPARATLRTGCEPYHTAVTENAMPHPLPDQPSDMEARCGKYLARTLSELGYRTFGVGKFHAVPDAWQDLGYHIQLHSEPLPSSAEWRKRDEYTRWIETEHPDFAYMEGFQGERSDCYYIPQCAPLPKELLMEGWAADQTKKFISEQSAAQPWFAFVSFFGPHPPFAPPIPFNRMYNPEKMPEPVIGDLGTDHLDDTIPSMNYSVWAEQIGPLLSRELKARYYGEISYIDWCIGRILDEVDRRPDADNTLIALFSDHGDHLGDHHAWQKESFFEASCHIPLLISWPNQLKADVRDNQLAALTDLFGVASRAAGVPEMRDGHDIISAHLKQTDPRVRLYGYYGNPGERSFKAMVRWEHWKLIYMANGGRMLLFNLKTDPQETKNLVYAQGETAKRMVEWLSDQLIRHPFTAQAMHDGQPIQHSFQMYPRQRLCQFGYPGPVGKFFPDDPAEIWKELGGSL